MNTKETRVSASVRRLRGDSWGKAKWMKVWAEVGQRILALPEEQQYILLSDLNTAVQSRLMVMERIRDANRNH